MNKASGHKQKDMDVICLVQTGSNHTARAEFILQTHTVPGRGLIRKDN